MRERPGLAADVVDIAHRDADFFERLAHDCFFQGLAGLDESRKTRIHRLLPLHAAGEQRLFVVTLASGDEGDDGGRQSRKCRQTTRRATHGAFVFLSLRGFATAPAEAVGSGPLHQLHGPTGGEPVVFVVAAVEREQVDCGTIGRIEAMRHIDCPHRDVAHHADEVNIPVARRRFFGLPHAAADYVEVAVPARVSGRCDRRNEARNIGWTAHDALTVPA